MVRWSGVENHSSQSTLIMANKKKRAVTKEGKQHASHGLHKGKKR